MEKPKKKASLPPDDLRCQRNDGKKWRCRLPKRADSNYCQHHYERANSYSKVSKPGRKSKTKRKPKRKPKPKPQTEPECGPDPKLRISRTKITPGPAPAKISGRKTSNATQGGEVARGSDGVRRNPDRGKFLQRILDSDSDQEVGVTDSNGKKMNVRECRNLESEFVWFPF